VYHEERSPPKLFTTGFPLTLPATAEVSVKGVAGEGSHVVLRLMWGPFPAPFPRVVTAVGIIGGIAAIAVEPTSVMNVVAGVGAVVLSFLMLRHQMAGEERMKEKLTTLFGGAGWAPRPH